MTYKATCPYCDWAFENGSKQVVQHERFSHVWSEHPDEKKIPWHKDLEPVEEIDDE